MSPGNQGVFQLLEKVTFEEFWHITTHENGAALGAFVRGPVRLWLAGGTGPKVTDRSVTFIINRAKFDCGDCFPSANVA